MIETIHRITCDVCKATQLSSDKIPKTHFGDVLLRTFVKHLDRMGWKRICSMWACPSCVRSLSASVRKEVKGKR